MADIVEEIIGQIGVAREMVEKVAGQIHSPMTLQQRATIHGNVKALGEDVAYLINETEPF